MCSPKKFTASLFLAEKRPTEGAEFEKEKAEAEAVNKAGLIRSMCIGDWRQSQHMFLYPLLSPKSGTTIQHNNKLLIFHLFQLPVLLLTQSFPLPP